VYQNGSVLSSSSWYTAVRVEVHPFEGYESSYRGKPLAVFSLADLADEEGDDEEEEL
jgi:hypothetical protein